MALIKTFTEWKLSRDENKALEKKKEAKQKYTSAISELLKEFEVEAVHELPSEKRKDFFEKLDSMLGENQQIREAYELAYDTEFTGTVINESTIIEENKLLKQDKLSSEEYQKAKKLKGFNPDNYTFDGDQSLYVKKANEAEDVDTKVAKDVIKKTGKNPETDDIKKDKKATDADEKVAKTVTEEKEKKECPKCEGEGCDHCDGKGYHMVGESKDKDLQRDVVLFVINNEPAYKAAIAAGKKGKMESKVPSFFEMYKKENGVNSVKIDKDDIKKIAAELMVRLEEEINESNIDTSDWDKDTEADFQFWMAGDDVSKNKDGSYSTQDAQWKNKLKNLDALKDYYAREFLESNSDSELVDIFLKAELNENVSESNRNVLRNILLTFESVKSITDVLVDTDGTAEIILANEVSLTLENSNDNFWLSNEEGENVVATNEGSEFLKELYTLFGKVLIMNEAEIKPNPKMSPASKKIYNAVSKAIKAPEFDEGDKKSDDKQKHSGAKKSEKDLIGEGKYEESKDEEISEMYKGLKETEKYKGMEESAVKNVAEMMYEMKYGMMEAGVEDVKEMYESSCNEGKYGESKMEGYVDVKEKEDIDEGKEEKQYEVSGHIDVDGDGKADLDASEMKHDKIAEKIVEMMKKSESTEEVTAESLIKDFQSGNMTLEEFQTAIADLKESEENVTFEAVEITDEYLAEGKLDKMMKDAKQIENNVKALKKKIKKDDSENVKSQLAAEEEKLRRVAAAIRDAREKANESTEINEEEISNEKEFREYGMTILKKAFGDEFEESRAKAVIDGLIKKYGSKGDWGAAVGALQSGLD